MPHSRYAASFLHDALGAHWVSGRHSLYARKVSSVVVRIAFATIVGALLCSVLASAAATTSRTWQSLESIRAAAEQRVRETAKTPNDNGDGLIVTAGELDPRLQLANCGVELRAFALNGAPLAARNTIAVRCGDDTGPGWTVYVPVTVEIEKPIFVMRRSLSRDTHILAEDVELQRRRVPGVVTTYYNDIAALRDQHLKRGLPAGAVLTADALTRDLLVKRGQEVSLIFGGDGLAVHAPGIAITEGGAADRIRVQNRTSLKIVEGTIESGNLVRVGL